MITQRDIDANNQKLDTVLSVGPDFAINWLRSAYHTHQDQLDSLLKKHRELQALFLTNVTRQLTVKEAQLTGVCRICRGEASAPFLLSYGEEFAHVKCLGCEHG